MMIILPLEIVLKAQFKVDLRKLVSPSCHVIVELFRLLYVTHDTGGVHIKFKVDVILHIRFGHV